MSKQFEDMTNAQLKEACEDFGLEVLAKNPAKPNKTEYLEALEKFKAAQDVIHGVEDEDEKDLEDKSKVDTETPARKPQSKAKLMRLDLFKKDRVIIHDQQEGQTKDEMIPVSWGNRLLGRQTDWITLDGNPQYVRRGALANLKGATTIAHMPKKGGQGGADMIPKKRFIVVDVAPLTETEIKELAEQQKMRNSKVA